MKNLIKYISKKLFPPENTDRQYQYQKVYFRVARFLALAGIRMPFRNDPREYWRSRNSGEKHGPEHYVQEDASTYVMFEELLKALPPEASFLEIGCNAGRNLNYLYKLGYRELAGVEINATAIHETLKNTFTELYQTATFYVGNAAEEIKKIPDNRYDVVFSIAVLEHILPEDKRLFYDMVRVSKKYIAVITGENRLYDFGRLFEDLGCKTVLFKLFYGEGNNFNLPSDKYDHKKYFFNETFLRIFIKNNAR